MGVSMTNFSFGAVRLKVYQAVCRSGRKGLNTGEVAQRLNISRASRVSPRVTELRNAGLIVGVEKRRNPLSGRLATVWVAGKYLSRAVRSAGLLQRKAAYERRSFAAQLSTLRPARQLELIARWRKSICSPGSPS